MGIGTGMGLAAVLWGVWMNWIPHYDIPNPAMPTLNAFDTFVKANFVFMESEQVGDAISKDVPKSKTHPQPYTQSEKEQLVAENVPCLKLLREGLKQDYRQPAIRNFTTTLPYYSKFRGMARLLLLEAQTKETKGDWDGAIRSRIDCLAFGIKIQGGAPMIGGLVGIAVQTIGLRDSFQVANRLGLRETKESIARLESLLPTQLEFSDTLREEKWSVLAGSMEALKKTTNLKESIESYKTFGKDTNGEISKRMSLLQFLTTSKSTMLSNYSNYMDQAVEASKTPYAYPMKMPPLPGDPFSYTLAEITADVRLKWIDIVTAQRLLLTVLALRAFRLEHGGKLPANLSELTPTYLKALPEDPFASRQPFRYRAEAGSVVLYSIGPDAVDDGGKSIDDKTKIDPVKPHSRSRYVPEQESKGDILAGVNAL